MVDTTATEAKISIKVIVDKVRKRVVYAVADHTFVDILFSFMTLPLGTIFRILGKLDDKKFEALGNLNNLYQSLKDFPECYFATEECKFMLFNPRSLSYDHCRNLKLEVDDTEPIQYHVCINFLCSRVCKFLDFNNVSGKGYRSSSCNITTCGECRKLLNLKYVYWHSDVCVGGGVFVSDTATFIITDDLFVEPYTSASSIRLLTAYGVTDIDHLEERNLDMSSHQVLQFFKTALSIDCPFTYYVFSEIHNSIPDTVGSGQDTTFDQFNLVKEEVSASSKIVLEVSLQKSTGKLLFADAKEDFVEFLFGSLSIPLGTVIGTLMNGTSSMSCMDNLFKSISNMSVGRYLKSQDIKDMLLKPHIGQKYSSKYQIFTLSTVPIHLVDHEQKDPMIDGGLLKQCGMFVVKDDLTVTPSSLFSTVDVLKKLKVLPEDIERYEVSIGLKEGLSMLKASLRSCSSLTNCIKHQLKK